MRIKYKTAHIAHQTKSVGSRICDAASAMKNRLFGSSMDDSPQVSGQRKESSESQDEKRETMKSGSDGRSYVNALKGNAANNCTESESKSPMLPSSPQRTACHANLRVHGHTHGTTRNVAYASQHEQPPPQRAPIGGGMQPNTSLQFEISRNTNEFAYAHRQTSHVQFGENVNTDAASRTYMYAEGQPTVHLLSQTSHPISIAPNQPTMTWQPTNRAEGFVDQGPHSAPLNNLCESGSTEYGQSHDDDDGPKDMEDDVTSS